MVRALLAVLSITAGLAAGLTSWALIEAIRRPYDSEGRYFDPVEEVVYSDGAPLFWGCLAASSGLLAVVAALAFRRVGATPRNADQTTPVPGRRADTPER